MTFYTEKGLRLHYLKRYKVINAHSSMVREVLLVNWLYHIFQCKLSLNTKNCNVTCLRKISSKCSSQINFPNMWHWSMSHFWWDFSQTCFNSYLYTLLECKSNDFKNVTLKNPYLLTRVEKQSKTRPSASCWIVFQLLWVGTYFSM